MPCTKSELDMESMLPLQIGIVDDDLVGTGPKSGPKSGGPLEFLIPPSGDNYLDLSHCYRSLKCRVLKADGSSIETLKSDASWGADTSVAPLNLMFNSLFRQVDLAMNDALVAMSGDTYPYRAAQLWMHCQGDLVKAPGRLVEGRRWKVWCSGKRQPHQSAEDDH